jgi:hypothetical protein
MHNYYSNRGRAAPARGFMALFAIMLAMGLGLMARPAEAAPFAYVAIPGPPDAVSVRSRSRRTGNMSMSRMARTMYRTPIRDDHMARTRRYSGNSSV